MQHLSLKPEERYDDKVQVQITILNASQSKNHDKSHKRSHNSRHRAQLTSHTQQEFPKILWGNFCGEIIINYRNGEKETNPTVCLVRFTAMFATAARGFAATAVAFTGGIAAVPISTAFT